MAEEEHNLEKIKERLDGAGLPQLGFPKMTGDVSPLCIICTTCFWSKSSAQQQ